MVFQPRPNHPYADAPRFPDGDDVSIDDLLPGAGPVEIEIGPGRGGFLFVGRFDGRRGRHRSAPARP